MVEYRLGRKPGALTGGAIHRVSIAVAGDAPHGSGLYRALCGVFVALFAKNVATGAIQGQRCRICFKGE